MYLLKMPWAFSQLLVNSLALKQFSFILGIKEFAD